MTTDDTTRIENAHVAAIRALTERIANHWGVGKVDLLNAVRDHADALAAELAAAEARAERYRTAYEAEFAYNMLAIVERFANPARVTEAAEVALEAWQSMKDHGDPVSEWKGWQPGDLDAHGDPTS